MFGGFRATLNLLGGGGGKRNKKHEMSSDMFVTGAYRTNKEEFYAVNYNNQTQKLDVLPQMRPAKSTPNLATPKPVIPNSRHTVNEVSLDPRGAEANPNRNTAPIVPERVAKKLEKQRIAEQKAREKQEKNERAKQEKLRKEKEKKDAQLAKQRAKGGNAQRPAAQPVGNPSVQPQVRSNAPGQIPPNTNTPGQIPPNTNNPGQIPATASRAGQTAVSANAAAQPVPPNTSRQIPAPPPQPPYTTNTLESSISRSSGPPPYSEAPQNLTKDKTGNVLYSKPVDDGSWDMISKHRQQINRPNTSANTQTNPNSSASKQIIMDLNYRFQENSAKTDKDNSEA